MRRTTALGLVAAGAFALSAPAPAWAEPPEDPEPVVCDGVACTGITPEAAVAAVWVGSITAGVLAGRALFGKG